MKKVLVIASSPRKAGNSAFLAETVAKTISGKGADVKLIRLADLRGYGTGCCACDGCLKGGKYHCVIPDGISPLIAELPSYDLVVFATPVYFFGLPAQLKAVIDRFYSLVKYEGTSLVSPLKTTKFALAAVAGDGLETSGVKIALENLTAALEYFGLEKPAFFFAGSCSSADSVRNNPETVAKAVRFAESLV